MMSMEKLRIISSSLKIGIEKPASRMESGLISKCSFFYAHVPKANQSTARLVLKLPPTITWHEVVVLL